MLSRNETTEFVLQAAIQLLRKPTNTLDGPKELAEASAASQQAAGAKLVAAIAKRSTEFTERLVELGAVKLLLNLVGALGRLDTQMQAARALEVLMDHSAEVRADVSLTVGHDLLSVLLTAPNKLTTTQATLLAEYK